MRLQPRAIADAIELGYHAGNLHWRVRFAGEALLVAIDASMDDYLARLGALIRDRRVIYSLADADEESAVIDLLTILQHADSAFPSGSFAFSNGIEGLSAMNAPLDRRGLHDVVIAFLRHRWATSDRIAVSLAHRANGDFDKVAEIDRTVEAATLAEPLRTGSRRNGNALLATHVRLKTPGAQELRALIADGGAYGHLPVVQGFVWCAGGVSEAAVVAMSGYSTAAGLIAAAVRLGRIGAVEAQAVLASLLPTIADLSDPVPVDAAIESFLPWVDVAAARQARAHLRLFAS